MQQEVVLALLAKEPSQGYELRARLDQALGPLGGGLNAGHIYVTLGRLEKAGLVALDELPQGPAQLADRKIYHLTPAGQERVFQWLSEVSWPMPSDENCCGGCETHSELPWSSRTTPMQPCCWRESRCGSRRTCAG
jgi:DNA-binding PadR family transcriptional regulator